MVGNSKPAAYCNHPINLVLRPEDGETFEKLAKQVEYCEISWPQSYLFGEPIYIRKEKKMDESKAVELYRKYRPSKFSEMVGQDEAIGVLTALGKQKAMPQFLLFTGPSGTGKTTAARILKSRLKCHDMDFVELNAASERGVDMVRDIGKQMYFAPMAGDCKIWLIDEAGSVTSDGQSAFLKMLEDTPSWCYFFFCTTDPQKLKPTIRTRATEIKFKPVGRAELKELIHRTAEAETGVGFNDDVSDKIVDLVNGSARKALVLLGSVIGIDNSDQQLGALSGVEAERNAIDLCRVFMNPRARWSDVCKVLKAINGLDEDVETIRHIVLSYFSKVALGGGKGAERAIEIIYLFRSPFYESKTAGLVLACYDAVTPKK